MKISRGLLYEMAVCDVKKRRMRYIQFQIKILNKQTNQHNTVSIYKRTLSPKQQQQQPNPLISTSSFSLSHQMQQFTINFLLLISSILGMYLFMSWTTESSWDMVINFLYRQNMTASLNQQFEIMATTGYYLVQVFMVGFILLQLYKHLASRTSPSQSPSSNPIIQTITHSFKTSFYQFITFLCLYFYFIRNHNNEITERQLILIPFWYLTARILYVVGEVMTTVAGVNLKVYGVTLTVFTYGVMLGKSFGYNLFLYL